MMWFGVAVYGGCDVRRLEFSDERLEVKTLGPSTNLADPYSVSPPVSTCTIQDKTIPLILYIN
jgi:hypothetical protein